ncbi:MAG: ArsR/SmtB family transcription factor [Eubacteriales bacterium]
MKMPKIIFDPEKGMVYDFTVIIINSLIYTDIETMYAETGEVPDETICASFRRMRSFIKKHDGTLLKLMFSLGQNGLSVYSSFYELVLKSDTIEDLINRLVNFDIELFFVRILSFFDIDHKFSYNFYNRIICDKELLMEYLNGINMTAENRLAFLNFIEFPQLMLSELKKDLTAIKKELEIEYEVLKDYRYLLYEDLKRSLRYDNVEEFYNRFINSLNISKDYAFEVIDIHATLYVPFAIQFKYDHRRMQIYFGKDFDKHFNNDKNMENDITFIFKAFTDTTRIRALHMLKDVGWVNYSQLSKELDVPLSSMAHHLDILVTAGIVKRRNEGKRTFLAINPDGVRNAANTLNIFI